MKLEKKNRFLFAFEIIARLIFSLVPPIVTIKMLSIKFQALSNTTCSEIISIEVIIMKKLPIGISSVEEMITGSYYYVDKTALIKEVYDLAGKIKLITRPRRFGKTLNMDMIRHFYSLDGKDLFEGLKIWEDKAFVKDNYHQYPVIFISFKEIKQTSWEEAKRFLEDMLSDLAQKIFLKIDETRDERLGILKRRYIDGKLRVPERVLKDLTEAMYLQHERRVILLIDEYDVPIEAAYTYQHRDPDYYENMVAFMRNLLTAALKDNPYLEFAILTGVYRVAKESIFSGLNNVAVYTIFENPMADKFGFLEDEVHELLKHYGLEGDMEAVRDWYNGYVFGNVEGIYNPWSVIYYVQERLSGKEVEQALQPYWINTSSNDLIIKQIETNPLLQQDLDKLLSGDELIVSIDPFLSLREIDQNPSGVWTLLAHAGYLNAYQLSADEYRVSLPNKEIEKFYKRVVLNWLEKKSNVAFYNIFRALREALKEGKAESFSTLLERYLSSTLSYFDIGYGDAERVYKAFVLGMLSMATNGYIIETETESGYGRVDAAVYPKDKRFGKYALVMELKRAESEEKLDDVVKDALNQIQERGYVARYERMGYKVVPMGIAFHGKKVCVRIGSR